MSKRRIDWISILALTALASGGLLFVIAINLAWGPHG